MADQQVIQNKVNELVKKIGLLQVEITASLLTLVKGKTNVEALAILNDLDINKIVSLKSSTIMSSFTAGAGALLETKELFSPIAGETLQVLLTSSEQYLSGEMIGMANTMKQ